jgi:heme O synthase-like polyprenyltransferase
MRASVPTLPVVAGAAETRRQILIALARFFAFLIALNPASQRPTKQQR